MYAGSGTLELIPEGNEKYFMAYLKRLAEATLAKSREAEDRNRVLQALIKENSMAGQSIRFNGTRFRNLWKM